MKAVFPVEIIIQKGGSDKILKLYLKNKSDHWLTEVDPKKVMFHFGKNTFSNPTEGEWQRYHSFNDAKTISLYLNENFNCGDELLFYVVEDKYGYYHYIFISCCNINNQFIIKYGV